MAEVSGLEMPEPESDDLGRYLEDTITIDWQTPAVSECARDLLGGLERIEERVRTLFEFVRDDVEHSFDFEAEAQTCRASEVLAERTGLCYSKSHLLAALLRFAGLPTGFCYVRLVNDEREGQFVLHGFNAVFWSASRSWIYLDPRGNHKESGIESAFRTEAPWSLAFVPDLSLGEAFLPFIYKRPAKRILDLLERAPNLAAVRRNLPDAV